MKLAWKPLFFVVLILVSVSTVQAQTLDRYDPTQEYGVHSVSQGENDIISSPIGIHANTFTPEAGASGIPNLSSRPSALSNDQPTLPNQSHWFNQMMTFGSGIVRGTFSRGFQTITTSFQTAVSMVGNTIQYKMSELFRNITSFYAIIDLTSQFFTSVQHRLNTFPETIWTILGGTGIGFGGGLFLFSFPLVRNFMFSSLQTSLSAVASVMDFALHTSSGAYAGVDVVFRGGTFAASYQTAKTWWKKKTGREIGSFGHDVLMTALVAVTVITVGYGSVLLSGGTKIVQGASAWLSGPSGTIFLLRNQQALTETTQECQIPGQCNSVFDVGITHGFNVVFAGIPDLELDRVTIGGKNLFFKHIAADTTEEVIEESGEEIAKSVGPLSRAMTQQAITFTRQDLEQRIGPKFVQQVFGDATGEEFERIASRWPNALAVLNESKKTGHVISKHLVSDEFLFNRSLSEDVVSSFNSSDDVLNSVEVVLSNPQTKAKIYDELFKQNAFQSEQTINMPNIVGRIVKKGSTEVTESNKVFFIFRKDINNQVYLLTSYPVER